MTGTILPPEETALLRSIANSAAVLFVLMRIEMLEPGRAVSVMEIAGILAVDTRTVARHLMRLSTAHMVTRQADRWMLTPLGRGTLFQDVRRDPHLSIEESEVLYLEPESPAQFVHLDREIEDIKLIKQNLSSISSECTNCATVPQILQAAAELLECEITLHPVMLTRETDFVLGWIAKAYADLTRPGSTLRSPGGLVYKRLLELATLPVMYQKNPTRGLPSTFLRQIGMVTEAEAMEERQTEAKEAKVDWMAELLKRQEEAAAMEYIYPAEDEVDGYGRNLRWLEVINDTRWDRPDGEKNKDKRGVGFMGNETVRFDGATMRVSMSAREVNDANNWHAAKLSAIYAEQCGDPQARVVFVCEVE